MDADERGLKQGGGLKVTGLKGCLLINFGKPKVEIKRIVNNFWFDTICVHLRSSAVGLPSPCP